MWEFRNLINSNTLPPKLIGYEISSRAAFLSIAAIFLSPLLSVIFLTSWNGNFSDWQTVARLFFLPALYGEIALCIVALAIGLNLVQSFGKLSVSAKIILGLWLFVLCGATILADANQPVAILGAGFWLVHAMTFAAVVYLIRQAGLEHLRLEKLAVMLPLASAAAGFTIYIFANVKGLAGDVDWVSFLPAYAHIRHTGYIFAPAIAVSLAHLAAKPGELEKTHLMLLTINSALMLWLGSRGPVFGILTAVMICMICFPAMRSVRFVTRAAVAGTAGAILSLLAPLPQHGAFGALQRFWNGSTDPTAFSSGRLNFWIETVDLIWQRPLLGHGSLQFQFISTNAGGIYKHPHESILQFLFDWGIFGGGAFLAMIALLIHMAFFKAKAPPYVKLVCAMGFATMCVFSLIDGLFFYAYPIAVSMIFLALPIATGFSERQT